MKEEEAGSGCGQLRGDKECIFSGATSSGQVRWKKPESEASSVGCPFSGVSCSGRAWRKVPEREARSVFLLYIPAQCMCVLDKVKGNSSSMGNVAPDEELNKIRSFQNILLLLLFCRCFS